MACHGHRIAESVAQPGAAEEGGSGLLRDTRATVLEHARVPRAPCIRRNAGSPTRSHNSPACAVLYIAPQAPMGCSLPSCADRHASAASSCMGETRDARCATFHAVCCCTLAITLFLYLLYCLGATARSHAAPAAAQIFTRKFYKMVAMLAETFVRTYSTLSTIEHSMSTVSTIEHSSRTLSTTEHQRSGAQCPYRPVPCRPCNTERSEALTSRSMQQRSRSGGTRTVRLETANVWGGQMAFSL